MQQMQRRTDRDGPAEEKRRKLRVLGVCREERREELAQILDGEQISCAGIAPPTAESERRAASLPLEAVAVLCERPEEAVRVFLEAYLGRRRGVAVILVTGEEITVEGMRLAMDWGVDCVLGTGEGPERIREAVCRECGRMRRRQRSAEVRQYDSRVLACCSSKGGAGTTTLAVNLAAALGQMGKKTAVVDLDLVSGDVRSALNLEGGASSAELAGEERVTPAVIKSYLLRAACGTDALCAPAVPGHAAAVKPELVSEILTTLRGEYDWVVADCGIPAGPGGPAECARRALEEADLVLFCITPEIPAVNGASAMLGKTLDRMPGFAEKMRLVVNRARRDGPVTAGSAARALGRKLWASLPRDEATAAAALNSGVPFMAEAGGKPGLFRKRLCRAYELLARRIAQEGI